MATLHCATPPASVLLCASTQHLSLQDIVVSAAAEWLTCMEHLIFTKDCAKHLAQIGHRICTASLTVDYFYFAPCCRYM